MTYIFLYVFVVKRTSSIPEPQVETLMSCKFGTESVQINYKDWMKNVSGQERENNDVWVLMPCISIHQYIPENMPTNINGFHVIRVQ